MPLWGHTRPLPFELEYLLDAAKRRRSAAERSSFLADLRITRRLQICSLARRQPIAAGAIVVIGFSTGTPLSVWLIVSAWLQSDRGNRLSSGVLPGRARMRRGVLAARYPSRPGPLQRPGTSPGSCCARSRRGSAVLCARRYRKKGLHPRPSSATPEVDEGNRQGVWRMPRL